MEGRINERKVRRKRNEGRGERGGMESKIKSVNALSFSLLEYFFQFPPVVLVLQQHTQFLSSHTHLLWTIGSCKEKSTMNPSP